MEIDKENLENALNSNENSDSQQEEPTMNRETELGFHQGALNTLVAERAELVKMVQNVEKIINMHIQRLEQLGVKVKKEE